MINCENGGCRTSNNSSLDCSRKVLGNPAKVSSIEQTIILIPLYESCIASLVHHLSSVMTHFVRWLRILLPLYTFPAAGPVHYYYTMHLSISFAGLKAIDPCSHLEGGSCAFSPENKATYGLRSFLERSCAHQAS